MARRRSGALAIAAALLFAAGCLGLIDDPASEGAEVGEEGTDGPRPPGTREVRDPIPSTTTRRLSGQELARTYEALFGFVPQSISMLPPESTELPFDRVVNAQTISPAHLDAYLEMGAEIGERLVAERRLDDLTDACPDEILPPAVTGGTTRVSGAGLGGGPDWAFAVDPADPSRTRVLYAPDPTVGYTHGFPAPGIYTLVLRAEVVAGPVDTTEVWVGGERVDAIADTVGPTEYTTTFELAESGPLVVEYRFLTEPDDHNLHIVFEELTISGPEDPGATTYAVERRACGEAWIDALAPRAFRRPITDDERARFASLFESGLSGGGFAAAVAMVTQAILASPSYLYLVEVGTPVEGRAGWFRLGPWERAARLSYALCEGPPDAALREAAAADALSTPDRLEAQARRLLEQPCGRRATRRFVEQWLGLDELPELNKSPDVFGAFTDEVRAELVLDGARYIDEMLWTERADLAGLFTSPVAWTSPSTAFLYGVDPPAERSRTALPAERAGVLTHPSVMAVTAPFAETSPVERGVFVMERILCRELPSPPAELEIAPPVPDPELTTRERWAEHSSNPVCATCHADIDPVGFAFEELDGIGRHRTEENGRPIDATGGVPAIGVEDGEIEGAAELSAAVAASPVAADCFARQWLRHSLGRVELEADEPAIEATTAALDERAIVEALVALVRTDSFAHRFETTEGSE